jgi:hypothetical protein
MADIIGNASAVVAPPTMPPPPNLQGAMYQPIMEPQFQETMPSPVMEAGFQAQMNHVNFPPPTYTPSYTSEGSGPSTISDDIVVGNKWHRLLFLLGAALLLLILYAVYKIIFYLHEPICDTCPNICPTCREVQPDTQQPEALPDALPDASKDEVIEAPSN